MRTSKNFFYNINRTSFYFCVSCFKKLRYFDRGIYIKNKNGSTPKISKFLQKITIKKFSNFAKDLNSKQKRRMHLKEQVQLVSDYSFNAYKNIQNRAVFVIFLLGKKSMKLMS